MLQLQLFIFGGFDGGQCLADHHVLDLGNDDDEIDNHTTLEIVLQTYALFPYSYLEMEKDRSQW